MISLLSRETLTINVAHVLNEGEQHQHQHVQSVSDRVRHHQTAIMGRVLILILILGEKKTKIR